jgi:hypothetical protein
MKFTINKTSGGDSEFELLNDGTYTFSILEVISTDENGDPFRANNGQRTQYIKVKVCEKESGLRLTHCVFLDPEKSIKVYHWLDAIGLTPVVGEEIDIDPDRWNARMFRGKIITKNGRNNIIATYSLSSSAPTALPDEMDDPIPYKKPTTTEAPDDDDVPF